MSNLNEVDLLLDNLSGAEKAKLARTADVTERLREAGTLKARYRLKTPRSGRRVAIVEPADPHRYHLQRRRS